MKKVYIAICYLFCFTTSKAVVVNISVTNFQFTPANVNVNVGDVVRFTFSGTHNASTNNVPNGLPPNASPLFSGIPGAVVTYDYNVTEPGTYLYVCDRHGDAATYTGMRGQFVASGVVPVTLSSFTVSGKAKHPLLQWTTETELNADYFSVRRSTDGIHFKEIAKVNAVGNSVTEQAYSYNDPVDDLKNNYIYYELAIRDKDGKQKLSNIQFIRNDLSAPILINSVSPNPISRPGELMVYFNALKKGYMKVKVFDGVGKLVINTDMAAFPGINSGHVHVCDLHAGRYSLQFSMEGMKETRTVIVN